MSSLPLINTVDVTSVGPIVELSFTEKVKAAIEVIKQQIRAGRRLICATSFGKDSAVSLSLILEAMRQLQAEGMAVPTLHVSHSNTLMENPRMDEYTRLEITKLKAYAVESGLPIRVWVSSPSLSNHYLAAIIGGRTVASLPDNGAKCQQMAKRQPLDRTKARIVKQIKAEMGDNYREDSVITVIGTRRDESSARGRAMEERGESEHDAVNLKAEKGGNEWFLSPVAAFTTFDIFEYIGNVTAGRIQTYSDFQELVEIYRDSQGGECMVNVMLAGNGESKTACNARFGCYLCLRVSSDKSMENMLAEENGRFSYMKPLNDFREYLGKRHYDPAARNFLARSVDEETGEVVIAPNAYAPDFCLELLRYALTIDADELDWASRNGKAPRFQMIGGVKVLLAIDFQWARYGYQAPFTALKEYRDIVENGMRYYIPTDVPDFDRSLIDFKTTVKAPFADRDYYGLFQGLRDIQAASGNAEQLVEKANGVMYSAVNTDFEYGFDLDGAEMFIDFELDRVLKEYGPESGVSPSSAVHLMSRYGFLLIKRGGESELDRMLRMSNQIHRLNLRPLLNKPVELADRLREIFQGMAPAKKPVYLPPPRKPRTRTKAADVMSGVEVCPAPIVRPTQEQLSLFL